ncbi:hypothetical protein HY085_00485 [Candidatus Gottesmanbacteria bacterium]|nr:hypothetical protein [Candidatus Gottesmanbacteria bacterium]
MKKLTTIFIFLTVFLIAPKTVLAAAYCADAGLPIAGYINTCSSPQPPPPTSNNFCQNPWSTWCSYVSCASFGTQTVCQDAKGSLCGGWGSCLWCSGVYSNCTGWGACSPSCGAGTQTRTCYDTLCGKAQTQSQNCNNGPCCPITANISGAFSGGPNNLIQACASSGSSGSYCSTAPSVKRFAVGDSTGSLSSGLISYWNMNESSGNVGDFIDSSTGTNYGTTTATSLASLGSSRYFNASSVIVTANETNFDFNYNQPFSIGAWIKTPGSSDYKTIVAKAMTASPYSGFTFRINGLNQLEFVLIKSNVSNQYLYVTATGTNFGNTNIWYYVTATYNGSGSVGLYVNGNPVATTIYWNNIGTGPIINNEPLLIGKQNPSPYAYFYGSIDEVGVWNKKLTDAEISSLFNSGNGNTISQTTPVPTAYSVSVPTNASYTVTGSAVTNYTVTSSFNPVSVSCGNVTGPTITYAVCVPVCSSNAGCNDSNSCTTDTCNNPGTCSSSCTNTNNPVNGTWGAPYGACIGGTQTMTCNGASCGGTCPGSNTRACVVASNPGAGIVESGGTINSGAGQISRNNNFNLTSYSNATPAVSYAGLLTAVAKNAGAGNNFDSICDGPKTDSITLPGYTIYCYVPSGFTGALQAAAASGTNILYPVPDWGSPNPITSATTVNSKTVVFVNGDLSINTNVTVGANGGAVFVTNGNVAVDPTVTRIDGIYIFNGNFNDGASASQLNGNGSLLGIGTGSFTFGRTYTGGAAESWTYEPKYLDLFKKILSTASYTWKELPPQ